MTTLTPNAAADVAAHLHSYTNLITHGEVGPLMISRGEGVYVEDEAGRRYIEGMSGLWCASLGFNHPRLVRAGIDALQTLPYYHTFNHRSNPAVAKLAERLLALAPSPMAKVFFANSGSEANDSAIKMIWYYHNAIGKPKKKKIIARDRAYHGVTVASASLGGLAANHDDFDLPIARVLRTGSPHFYRDRQAAESAEQFSSRRADELERLILEEGPDTVAAFFAEPVMGAGGVIVPPPTYFEKIQAVLQKYDVLLVADEVICGFGRTGEMFGSSTFGMTPDILTCAKSLSSAYVPISAVMISTKIHEAIADNSARLGVFGHGYTYSGHPVAAAVALETLQVYEDDGIINRVQTLAPRFSQGLIAQAKRPFVGDVRAVGLIGALELMKEKSSRTPFDPAMKIGARVAQYALKEGLIVRAMGDTIALCPPLIMSSEEMDEMFQRLSRALDRVQRELEQ